MLHPSYLLQHVREVLLDDGERFSIHSKVVHLLCFVLVYGTHILQTDVHFLLKQAG